MRKFWPIILVLTIIFGRLLIPEPKVATDFPFVSSAQLQAGFSLPQTWKDRLGNELGENHLSTLWAWPIDLIYGLGAQLGLSFSILERIFGLFLAPLLAWISIKKFTNNFGALFYVVNTYFLLLLDGGQYGLGLAYAILPLCFYLYQQALDNLTLKTLLKLAISLIILSVFDPRIIYLLGLLVLIYLLTLRKLYLITNIKICLFTGLSLIGFHAYWLIPALLTKLPSLPSGYSDISQVNFLSFATWKHTLLLLQPHWPRNIFGLIEPIRKEFILIPLLSIFGLFHSKKWFWGIVAVISVFLAKGSQAPLSSVYSWLFTHLPGFDLFRDPVKFYFLISFAYTILIGHAVAYLGKKHYLFYFAFSVYLLILSLPLVLGKSVGTFSSPRYLTDYQKLANYLDQDKNFGRVLWLPQKPPLHSSSIIHPAIGGIDLTLLRPFAAGVIGDYEVLNYLRDATNSGQMLNLLGIKTVVYSPLDPLIDPTKTKDLIYHDYFFNQLSQTPWAKEVIQFGQISLLKTASGLPPIFISPQTTFVVGSDDFIRNTPELSSASWIFADEFPQLLNSLKNYPYADVINNGKQVIDVVGSLIPSGNLFFPASALFTSPDRTGWWQRPTSELIWWRNFLHQKYQLENTDFDYQGGWAIAEGNLSRDFSHLPYLQPGQILLARVLKSPLGGTITVNQTSKTIGSISTLQSKQSVGLMQTGLDQIPNKVFTYDQADFFWQEIGQLESTDPLTITTQGQLNVINALAIISPSDLLTYTHQAQELLSKSLTQNSCSGQISSQRLSSSHYRLHLTDLTCPATLVFSQSYDPLWRLNDQPPIPVYGILNGFPVFTNGEYDLIYSPQKFVGFGLLITLFTLLLLLVGFYEIRKK